MTTLMSPFDRILTAFEEKSGLFGVEHNLLEKNDGSVLIIKVAYPTERLFRILEDCRAAVTKDEDGAPLATLVRKQGGNLLDGPEGNLLLRTLTESQNVNRYSFQKDFMAWYTRSVFGAESQVTASANHVVYGRRGAGKSMLLLYATHERTRLRRPFVWIDMQVYARREDEQVISHVLRDILEQTKSLLRETAKHDLLINKLQEDRVPADRVRQLLPDIRRLLSDFANKNQELFIFLDDFHVVGKTLQPLLLDMLYAFARGNRIFLKLSAIETLTRTYDPSENIGLQIPQDAQLIRLDFNLTTPDKATAHIDAILNSHAQHAGIASIRRLCTSGDVIPRLTWVAAGVPRDALNLFAQAITKATLDGRHLVSVSNVNVAASETLGTKLSELESDASQNADELKQLLDRIQNFCVTEKRQNAFLVEIRANNPLYENIRNLVHLRLLHVITEGVTIGQAGRKYLGLILDYGFYTGVRAARSVDLFNRQTNRVARKELRRLPVFEG